MTLKERAEQVFNQLNEKQLRAFVALFGDFSPEGNAVRKSYTEYIEETFQEANKQNKE
ncbi:MAG: hypothetical protein IJJ69_07910 [Oscillospiraceae bacterium]|nr:hypothetical protein [Oscillospiraceae bacterium]